MVEAIMPKAFAMPAANIAELPNFELPPTNWVRTRAQRCRRGKLWMWLFACEIAAIVALGLSMTEDLIGREIDAALAERHSLENERDNSWTDCCSPGEQRSSHLIMSSGIHSSDFCAMFNCCLWLCLFLIVCRSWPGPKTVRARREAWLQAHGRS